MKDLIFTLIFLKLFSSVIINSQIILTSEITPRPGDIQYRVSADTAGIEPGNSGPNQNWTFNTLTRRDSIASVWISASNTPYWNLFPNAKISVLDTCYSYFDTVSNRVEYTGQYTQGTAIPYTNFQTVISYPFGYNSVVNDNFAAVFNDNGDIIHRTGSVNLTGDAWGTIHLPYGTFQNALRLKYVITTRDSSSGGQFVLVTTYTIYEWHVPGRKFSVFNIVYINLSFPGDSGFLTFKNVTYNPSSQVIGINSISEEIPRTFYLYQNYPNPFNPETKIKFDVTPVNNGNVHVQLKVYDMLGREAVVLVDQSLKPGTYETALNGSDLAGGVYFYTLTAGNFKQTKKLILIK